MYDMHFVGGFPYPTIGQEDLLRLLKAGYRMEKPDNCSQEVLVFDCSTSNLANFEIRLCYVYSVIPIAVLSFFANHGEKVAVLKLRYSVQIFLMFDTNCSLVWLQLFITTALTDSQASTSIFDFLIAEHISH